MKASRRSHNSQGRGLSGLILLTLALTVSAAEPPIPEGPWEGFPRTQPEIRYESDIGANKDYVFGVTKSFPPYKDPDRAEVEDLKNPLDNPAFSSYNLIVIVNKSTHPLWGPGQTLRVYQRGKGLLYYWLISSGAKGHETTSGYFRPLMFSSRHWSGKYDAPMLWAVFFNGGMALHSSLDRESMREMGQAGASHGCVHVEDYRAEELFHLVGQSGFGSVDVIDRNQGLKTGAKVASYRTLIIVGPTQHWDIRGSAKASPPQPRSKAKTPATSTQKKHRVDPNKPTGSAPQKRKH